MIAKTSMAVALVFALTCGAVAVEKHPRANWNGHSQPAASWIDNPASPGG
jgi:hypothetical protein